MRALQTDLYQLTMAAGYFHRGLSHTTATCELFVRRLPAARRYLVAATVAGDKLKGVRLDSGDLGALSKEVRAVLDSHGLQRAQIVASGDLDEYKIAALLESGAPIDSFGVGTELVSSKDAPSLGGVYKVVAFERDRRRGAEPGRVARPCHRQSGGTAG